MTTLAHEMILASAGSGKTYALTNRFVQLLALGAKPERIVALTFTRKAAGEFFDEILNKLARAARDEKEAARIAGDIGAPDLKAADFLRMLREVVNAMHRLSLGTLDSFFARVVRTFPLELGIGGDFEVLQDHGALLERQRVLRQLFARSGADLEDAQKEFIEAFKRATFGAEEKRLAARLDQFIDAHQELYLNVPDAEAWGNPDRVWPEGSPWLAVGKDPAAAVATMRTWAASLDTGPRKRWEDFLNDFEGWSPGATLSKPMEYILEKVAEAWPALVDGAVELTIERKKQKPPPEICAALVTITRALFAGEFKRRLEMTRGIYTVLRGYEAIYHDLVRRTGRLTFADVQRLLTPGAGAPRLSSGSIDPEEARLLIDWRLDAKFDHWLLDEFQDTSHGQWSVLSNLIDEAVQDPEGRRSLFYVGDVKQAIYGWRGGDTRLFREIFDRYNAVQEGAIVERRLDQSWRSGPAILAAVNRVFGNAKALERLVPITTAERWTQEWRDHVSARPSIDGQTAWLHGDDEEARAALTLRLIDEIKPIERGLSVAVLVQSNERATWLADYLRREGGMPAMAASDLHVCIDNPLTSSVLALLKAAAHPGDRFAWEHVLMTPLADAVVAADLTDGAALTNAVLRQIHADGFARTVETWLRRVESSLRPDDVFSRERARQLVEAAQLFDEAGGRDVAEFVLFAERHVVRDVEASGVVQVMTIHKSKGLGFDVVLLPDLEGQTMSARRRDGLAVQQAPDRSVEWVLDLPPKLFHSNDEVLSTHVRQAEADAAYEKLCLYYVAMTRAKRAMYLITKPVSAKSASANFPRLLAETLGTAAVGGEPRVGAWCGGGSYSEGNPDWFAAIPFVTDGEDRDANDAAARARIAPELSLSPTQRYQARTPSGTKGGTVTGMALFGAGGTSAASFGTAVHAAFAAVEWGGVSPEVEAAWAAAGLGETVRAEVRACLAAPEIAAAFAKIEGAEVWRERSFEIVLDGAWITGVFDRVVLRRGADGRPESATVYDFKTDKTEPGGEAAVVERYAGQLGIYRRAVATLAGLPEVKVTCALVLTGLKRVMVVSA
jgi:ATP-dependent exoDNAse (exonuclease V) beta subunit (contains helicase and exonuclease domains)